jgi:hypothetical protein
MRKNKIIAFIVLTILNILLVNMFNLKISVQNIVIIQVFLFSLSFSSQLLLEKLLKNKKTTPAHFLSVNILRIALCIVFLLPVILNFRESEKSYIYNFFIIYFSYLFLENYAKVKKQDKNPYK